MCFKFIRFYTCNWFSLFLPLGFTNQKTVLQLEIYQCNNQFNAIYHSEIEKIIKDKIAWINKF